MCNANTGLSQKTRAQGMRFPLTSYNRPVAERPITARVKKYFHSSKHANHPSSGRSPNGLHSAHSSKLPHMQPARLDYKYAFGGRNLNINNKINVSESVNTK